MFGYDSDPARRVDAGQALEGFLRAVGIPGEHIPAGVQDRSRLLRSVLAAYAQRGRRLLVVVDNVAASEQTRSLLPSDGTCAAIVTSRHTLADLDARLLNLDTLPNQEAIKLLNKALALRNPADTRVHDHPGDARRLAESCGGLPLALQITAALLAASPAKPLAVMAGELADAAMRLEEIAYADRAVRAVFDTSYQQLPEEQAWLFRLLSVNPGPDISTSAAAALAGLPESDVRRNLEALARALLIEPGSVYGRWRMHDLIRLHSAQHGHAQAGADHRAQALTRLLAYYLAPTRAATARLGPTVADPAARGFATREPALAWLDTEYPSLTAATYAAANPAHHTIARDLPKAMWHFLSLRRHFNDWITLSQTSLAAARTLGDQVGQSSALNSLGVALRGVRRFEEAIIVHQQDLQICRDASDRYGERQALGNLGNALQEVRRFEVAVTAHQQAAQIFRDSSDRHGEGVARFNLGNALHELVRFEEAFTAHRQAIEIFRDTGDRNGEGQALNNLGLAILEMETFEP